MKKVKVIGMQRSGTYWLSAMIHQNCDVNLVRRDLVNFWKHALPGEVPPEHYRDTVLILIYKPIEFWLPSVVRKPIDLFRRRPPLGSNKHPNLDMLVDFYHKFMSWEDKGVYLVNYMDLVRDPEGRFREMCSDLCLPIKPGDFVNPKSVKHSKDFSVARVKYYLDGEPALTPEMLSAIERFKSK